MAATAVAQRARQQPWHRPSLLVRLNLEVRFDCVVHEVESVLDSSCRSIFSV